MANLKQELIGVVQALNDASIPYALCGGLAVVLHGYPRTTRDIDLLIRPEDWDRVLAAVENLGFRFVANPMTLKAGTSEEQRIHRVSKMVEDDALTLDCLLVNPRLAAIWNNRIEFQIGDDALTVVDRNGLIEMKKSSGRPKDLEDIEQLSKSND